MGLYVHQQAAASCMYKGAELPAARITTSWPISAAPVHAGSAAVAEDAGDKPAALLNTAVWLSLMAEGTPLTDASAEGVAADPVTDWRLVVAPPLVVENLLPVRGIFHVWEQAQVSSSHNACTSCRLPACSDA